MAPEKGGRGEKREGEGKGKRKKRGGEQKGGRRKGEGNKTGAGVAIDWVSSRSPKAVGYGGSMYSQAYVNLAPRPQEKKGGQRAEHKG